MTKSNPRSPLAAPTVATLVMAWVVATFILLAVVALPASAPAQTA